MTEFLLGVACFILATVALAVFLVMRGPADADRMMSAQLLGTGGVAVLLLAGSAIGQRVILDVALVLALLAAFAGLAFVKAGFPAQSEDPEDGR